MIHNFFLVGDIKEISVFESKDPTKEPSALVLLQYGKDRQATGNQIEFVNATMVRIPNFLYAKLKDRLHVGAGIQVNGHIQGVFRPAMERDFFNVELVADRVSWEDCRAAELAPDTLRPRDAGARATLTPCSPAAKSRAAIWFAALFRFRGRPA